MTTGRTFRLEFPSLAGNVVVVGSFVKALAEEMGLGDEACYHLQLCVVEAANNCVSHAHQGRPEQTVELVAELGPEEIVFLVADRGPAWELPPARPPIVEPDDVAGLAEGGRGIFLIRSLMDEVTLTHDGGRNILRLVKKIRGRADGTASRTGGKD